MFEPMRRQERSISREAAEAILQKGEYGIFSTVGPDGYPCGVPVNYVCVKEMIGFHCAPSAGQKLKNLKGNDRVCFTVVGNTRVLPAKFSSMYESVMVFGRAREAGPEEKRTVLEALIEKYCPRNREAGMAYINRFLEETGVCLIQIEHMTGKAHQE